MSVVGNDLYFYARAQKFFELSNFYPSSFQIGEVWWKTVEHYFQAQKSPKDRDREYIRGLPTPNLAKRVGRQIRLREDWEEIKEDVMYRALKAKFTQNSTLKMILLSTGSTILKERSPDDVYWGYKGKNRLGILLMKLRDELSEERD